MSDNISTTPEELKAPLNGPETWRDWYAGECPMFFVVGDNGVSCKFYSDGRIETEGFGEHKKTFNGIWPTITTIIAKYERMLAKSDPAAAGALLAREYLKIESLRAAIGKEACSPERVLINLAECITGYRNPHCCGGYGTPHLWEGKPCKELRMPEDKAELQFEMACAEHPERRARGQMRPRFTPLSASE